MSLSPLGQDSRFDAMLLGPQFLLLLASCSPLLVATGLVDTLPAPPTSLAKPNNDVALHYKTMQIFE